MTTYLRDADIAVISPGYRGEDIAGEAWERGGAPESDLLARDKEELAMYRIVVRDVFPESVIAGLAGRRLRDVIEIPPFKGFSPLHGNDHGNDALHALGDAFVAHARSVARGTLIAVPGSAKII